MSSHYKKMSVYRINKCFTENHEAVHPEDGYLIQQVSYNQKGEIIQEEDYNENSEIINKIVHHFDDQGFVVKEEIFFSEDEIAESRNIEHDASGKPIRIEQFYSEGGSSFVDFKYDENGRLLERKVSDEDETEQLETRTYDEKGNLKQIEIYNYDQLSEKTEFIHDGDEVLIVKSILGEFGWEITKTYNKNEKIVKVEHLDEKGKVVSYSDYIEDAENHITTVVERSGSLLNKYQIETDEHGNILSQMDFTADGDLKSQLINRYDGNHNIIFSSYRSLIQEVNIINSYSLIYIYEF